MLLGILFYFVFAPFFHEMLAIVLQAAQHPKGTPDPAQLQAQMAQFQRYAGLIDLAELIVYPVILVGITKEALGLRKGFRPVYLQFGQAELLVLGTIIAMIAITVAGALAVLLGGALLAGLSALIISVLGIAQFATKVAIGMAAGIATFVAFVVCAYLFIRAFYLVIPVSVAEKRFGIFRSWELMRGNVWRSVAVFVLTVLPLFVLEMIIATVFIVPFMMTLVAAQKSGGPQAALHQLENFFSGIPQILPWYAAGVLLLSPIIFGLMISPAAFAYRALVPAEPEGPTPQIAPA